MSLQRRPIRLCLCLLAVAACGSPPDEVAASRRALGGELFQWAIDQNVVPQQQKLRGRALAASRDQAGRTSTFFEDEVLISPTSQSELTAFLARVGGKIIQTNEVPKPPAKLGRKLSDADRAPTTYRVQVDPSQYPLSSFSNDALALGVRGTSTFSSERGARLMAMITHEAAGSLKVSPNYFASPAGFMHSRADFSGQDSMKWAEFASDKAYDANVSLAWQFLTGYDYGAAASRVPVAILDDGFWLDNSGHPKLANGEPGLDFPWDPIQYDFIDNDAIAAGENESSCGDFECPWHGSQAASVAAGIGGNEAGAAGTGLYADPWLFRVDGSLGTAAWALKTAREWGAKIVSMSWGLSCDSFCHHYVATGLLQELAAARNADMILVAAAGNDHEQDVDEISYYPCVAGTICVGASDKSTGSSLFYSNVGESVRIWAPSDIRVAFDGQTNGQGSLGLMGGTSASTPFVAGVISMMVSINGSLDQEAALSILQQTMTLVPGDDDMGDAGVINAFEAVKLAANHEIPKDAWEGLEGVLRPTLPIGDWSIERTIHNVGDIDTFELDINDMSDVELWIERMKDLGHINLELLPAEGQIPPTQMTVVADDPALRKLLFEDVAPGKWYVVVKALAAQPYRIITGRTTASIEPDQFEPNESEQQAAKPAINDIHFVTLHVDAFFGDYDYYKIDVPAVNPLLQRFVFQLIESDLDVDFSIRDATTNALVIKQTTKSAEVELAPGSYYVRVTAFGGIGRYAFTYGAQSTYELGPYIEYDRLWQLDPSGPIERWLWEVSEHFLADVGAGADLVTITGAGVHATALDRLGNVLAEGAPLRSGDLLLGERLSLAGVPQGTPVVIQATPRAQGALTQYSIELGASGR